MNEYLDNENSTPHVLTDGNVNLGKDKGSGMLLLTDKTVYALRTNNSAMATGAVAGGLIGGLIGMMIDKNRAKKRPLPEHLNDPEVQALPPKVQNKIKNTVLLTKVPLDETLQVKRTKLGYSFTLYCESKPLIIYQGLAHKGKIARHLEAIGHRTEQ